MSELGGYDLTRLNECLERDNATCDEIPENLHAHCHIPIVCPCGTRRVKTFQQIWENGGAFCKPCAKKNNTEKGRASREAKIPEYIKNQQREEQLIKEKEECELRMKRDEIVNGRRELLDAESDDTRFTHPTITTHCANKKGEVYNIKTGKLVKGTSRPVYGYIRDKFKDKTYERHRFLCECWYNTLIGDKYQVDHIDRNASNNNYSNLQMLTRLEHGKKTANDNKGIRRNNTKTSSKRVVRIKINDDNTEGEIITYESLKQAKEDNKIDVSSIRKSINTGNPFRGYLYEFEDEDNSDIEGEIWKDISIPSDKKAIFSLQVSNKGRLRIRNKAKEHITRGRKDNEGYYVTDYGRMHTLVARAFLGEAPEGMTSVDHIDAIQKGNNCVENLRWSNSQLQAEHSHNIGVEVYDLETKAIVKKFDSYKECAEFFNIPSSSMCHIVNLTKRDNNIRYKIAKTNYSVRKQELSLEDKRLRELTILEYQLEIYFRDNNKRKNNKELPTHIYDYSTKKFKLDIKFMTVKKRFVSASLNDVINERILAIEEIKETFKAELNKVT
jgi:hypothetical protein